MGDRVRVLNYLTRPVEAVIHSLFGPRCCSPLTPPLRTPIVTAGRGSAECVSSSQTPQDRSGLCACSFSCERRGTGGRRHAFGHQRLAKPKGQTLGLDRGGFGLLSSGEGGEKVSRILLAAGEGREEGSGWTRRAGSASVASRTHASLAACAGRRCRGRGPRDADVSGPLPNNNPHEPDGRLDGTNNYSHCRTCVHKGNWHPSYSLRPQRLQRPGRPSAPRPSGRTPRVRIGCTASTRLAMTLRTGRRARPVLRGHPRRR